MMPFLRLALVATSLGVVFACGGVASSSSTSSTSSSSSGSGGLGLEDAAADAGADGTTTGHIDRSAFPKTCSQGLAGLTPTGAFDAIEVRTTLAQADAGGGPPYAVVETRGAPCATATSAACKTSFDAAVVKTSSWSTNANYRGGPAPPPERFAYYVVTRGNSVIAIADEPALVAFLAPIDTVTEAIHVRQGPLGGASVCPLVRTDADGYSFLDDGCGPFTGNSYTTTEIVTKVARDGAVTTTQTAGPFPDPTFRCAPVP